VRLWIYHHLRIAPEQADSISATTKAALEAVAEELSGGESSVNAWLSRAQS
jgi:hypothetical protein